MEDELIKIAERTFVKTMREYTYFAEIGTELKKIQTELRAIAKRTKTVEQYVGIPLLHKKSTDKIGEKVLPTSSDKKHMSGIDLQILRTRKNLTRSQMADLLKVSHRKYKEWEQGDNLMVPWVEEEISRISKIHAWELQAVFKKEKPDFAGSSSEIRKKKPKRIPIKIITRDDINNVRYALKMSTRELAIKLGIPYSKMHNWYFGRTQVSDDVIRKFMDLQETVKGQPAKQINMEKKTARRNDSENVRPEEIKEIRDFMHWTGRIFALHLGIKYNGPLIHLWERGCVKPTAKVAKRIRLLQVKIKSGEIKPDYEGPLATVEEIRSIQKDLNYTLIRLSKELHISHKTLSDIYSGRLKISYRTTVAVRILQRKIQTGEVVPEIKLQRFPGNLIHEICLAYRFRLRDLMEKIGCPTYTMVRRWVKETASPSPEYNKKLWDLWNNAPSKPSVNITPETIYKLRRHLGLTQSQFAKKLGVIQASVSRWERNIVMPDSVHGEKLIAAFQESHIFDEKQEEMSSQES